MAVRLVIVDDSGPFRALAAELLASEGYEVVGSAGDGAAALALVGRERPDLVVLDVGLPDVEGFTLARRLAGLPIPPRVVLVSSRDWACVPEQVMESGAVGFVPKSELDGERLASLLAGLR